MKKTLLILACIILGICQLNAQEHRIVSNTERQITMKVTTGDLVINDINTERGTYSQITMDGFINMVENVGNPQLPMLVKTIEIPICGDLHVTATAGRVRSLTAYEAGINFPIYPTQPLYHKSFMGDREFVQNAETYATNTDYGMPLATVAKAGIARNINLANIIIYPVQVNPVTKMVTVYDDITVTVTYDDVDMAATREMKLKYASPEFSRPSEVVNAIEVAGERDVLATTPVKYVIIANDMFNGQLDSLANWKRRKGYLVEIAYTGTIGTSTTAIKNYISGLFTNATTADPAPTYVLLVGDVAQLPAYDGQTMDDHVTDLYYFQQVGGDFIPDCYYGRFSAQSVAQLTPQINKTLTYEQYLMPDPSYLDRAVLVAGEDGGSSGDYGYSMANPAMQYLENTYSSTYFTTVNSYYNPHASSNASSIRTNLSAGTGYANYSAHCSSSGWSIPSFSTSNVNSMTNTGKYGLMIGNCCQSNKFEETTCFGEALLRADNKGAVGYIGGTDYTYWYHDYYWAVGYHGSLSNNCTNCNIASYNANRLGAYDCLFHTHNEAYSSWHVTQGAIIRAGNMAVQDAYGATDNYVKYYWEIYQLMGDPSVMPWLGQANDMTIRIDNNAPINSTYEAIDGTTTFTVSTGAPYSYIALTQNFNLITAVLSDGNGNATLTFPALMAGETYELAASAQNYKTTFTTINAIPGEGARVTITNVAVNNNTQATAGANLTLNVNIENRFPDAATNTVINATTTSNQITLTDPTETVGTVNSGANQTLTAAFALQIATNIADGDIAPIHFTVSYLSNGVAETTTYDYNLVLVDAHLNYVSDNHTISGGNNDNIIDPGETVTITIVDENDGHATANNVVSQLSTYYNLAPVTSGSVNIGTVNAQNQCTSTFTVSIGSTVPTGTLIPYYHHIYSTTNSALSRVDTVWLTVGNPIATEDWESGDMNSYAWTSEGDYPWEIINSGAYAGTYCARSTNYNVNSSISDLELTINASVDGDVTFYSKVSSESRYDFFKFYLDGVEMTSRSGTGNWQQSSYPVTAGTHTLKFTYEKDYSQKSGDDRAWIDNITFPGGGSVAPVPEIISDISDSYTITSGNGDADINPGEAIALTITTENISSNVLTNVSSVLSTNSPYATIANANQTISSIAANSTATTTYNINIAANTPDSTLISFTHNVTAGSVNAQYTSTIFVYEIATARLVKVSDSYVINGGNNDNIIDPGETVILTIIDENTGRANANNVVSQLSTYYYLAPVTNNNINIGTLNAQSQCSSAFTINIGNDVPVGTIIPYVHHIYSTTDANAYRVDTIYLTVGSTEAVEDWETGDLTAFDWSNNSSHPWIIVNDANEAHGGSYYAKSGNSGVSGSTSDLELTTTTIDGEISFYAKVASEAGYDFFKFYIDGTQQVSVSGGVQNTGSYWNPNYVDTCTWRYYSYPITAGEHTFKFSFTKDNSTNSGSDCAKIDDIIWPTDNGSIAPVPQGIVITDAGLNANSNGNEGEAVTFDATLENNSENAINNVTLTLSTSSNDITLTDITETIPTMAANSTVPLSSIFAGTIANNVADGTPVNCTVTADFMLEGVATQQTYNFTFPVHAGIVHDDSHTLAITAGNGDTEINSGETIEVTITTQNIGATTLNNISSVLSTTSTYAIINNATQAIQTIAPNGMATTTYTIDIDANTPDNTNITFTHTADAGIHGMDTYTFTINVMTPAIVDLNDINESHSIVTGNNDNDINPGETVRFLVATRNDGRATAHNAVSTLTSDSQYATIGSANQQIGTITGYASINSQFDVVISALTPDNTVINFTHTMITDEDTCTLDFSITVVEVVGEVNLVDVSHTVSIISGNGDNDINPGETIKVTVYSRNDGNAGASDIISTLTTTSGYAAVEFPVVNFNAAAPGATLTSQYNVSVDSATPNNTVIPFTHTITDGSSTANSDFNITVLRDDVGIAENGESAMILVYPNPTSGVVNIECEKVNGKQIRVYDVYGKVIVSQNAENELSTIDLSHCANGVYIVRIFNGNETVVTTKIVKQ